MCWDHLDYLQKEKDNVFFLGRSKSSLNHQKKRKIAFEKRFRRFPYNLRESKRFMWIVVLLLVIVEIYSENKWRDRINIRENGKFTARMTQESEKCERRRPNETKTFLIFSSTRFYIVVFFHQQGPSQSVVEFYWEEPCVFCNILSNYSYVFCQLFIHSR